MDMLTDGQTTDSALSPQTLWIWGWGGGGGAKVNGVKQDIA